MTLIDSAKNILLNSFDSLSAPLCFSPKDFLLSHLPDEGESIREVGMGKISLTHTRHVDGRSDISIAAIFLADYGTQAQHGSRASIEISAAGDVTSITIQSGLTNEREYVNRSELNSSTIAGLIISAFKAPAKDSLNCLYPLEQLSDHLKRNCTVTD